jgi:CheY-like chemotaxis protein
MNDTLFSFADEAASEFEPWNILIVDDEPGVHDVTKLVLGNFRFEQRPLKFFHAYSGAEARTLLKDIPDLALVLLDVVMEHETAGLDLVKHIRADLQNHFVRIVLRTGQPGQAPEQDVIANYDINDYKDKTELTAQKLYTTLYATLRAYRDVMIIEQQKRGLERVIHASAQARCIAKCAIVMVPLLSILLWLRPMATTKNTSITSLMLICPRTSQSHCAHHM